MHDLTRRMGEILLASSDLTEEQLAAALEQQLTKPVRIGSILVDAGTISLKDLRRALATRSGLPAAALDGQPEPAVRALVPVALIVETEVLPLRVRGAVLTVGAVTPSDSQAIERVRAASGYAQVAVEILAEAEFAHHVSGTLKSDARDAWTRVGADGIALSGVVPCDSADEDPSASIELAQLLVHHAFQAALLRQATAIFFTPIGGGGRVELRVDGALQTLFPTSARVIAAASALFAELVNRDGELKASSGEISGRFSVSTLRTTDGLRIALRRLDYVPSSVGELQLPAKVAAELKRRQQTSGGLYLVVGPRDSGLLETAAALTAELSSPERQTTVITTAARKLVSGAVQVVPKSYEIAGVFWSALAQDPDVVLLEDISDPALAEAATAAAMNGHTVVATMAGSRAIDAALDLSAAATPYRVAASLQAVVAQRLCRRVCLECSVGFELTDAEREELSLPAEAAAAGRFARGKGCASCFGTGYQGRVPIAEVLFASPTARQHLRAGSDAEALGEAARKHGFHTLWESGIVAVMKGLTTPEELRCALGRND
ncbi:MAG: type IV pilus assembly protein PilB [Myxococcota bacterium]|jgi:type IV pilus assembly protein PilB